MWKRGKNTFQQPALANEIKEKLVASDKKKSFRPLNVNS